MDIIGKVYKDYFCNIKNLDGNSHLLNNFKYGGLFNLLENWEFFEKQFWNINFKFFVVTDSINLKEVNLNINTNILATKEKCPKAFIIDFNNQRTSFVIDDIAIKIPHFKKESEEALVFYGDKLIPSDLLSYKKIIIDTAGNNYLDLISLAKYNYPKNSIISISDELLTDELIDLYSIKSGFLILSHSPKKTEIISKGISNTIINEYYLPPKEKLNKIKATGLGDKFVFLIACNHFYLNCDLIQSVKKSQKMLSNIILK
tara:strand:- start:308 stop:1084 length:777 start_codon:yes stop_codon:yes gene_type:complete